MSEPLLLQDLVSADLLTLATELGDVQEEGDAVAEPELTSVPMAEDQREEVAAEGAPPLQAGFASPSFGDDPELGDVQEEGEVAAEGGPPLQAGSASPSVKLFVLFVAGALVVSVVALSLVVATFDDREAVSDQLTNEAVSNDRMANGSGIAKVPVALVELVQVVTALPAGADGKRRLDLPPDMLRKLNGKCATLEAYTAAGDTSEWQCAQSSNTQSTRSRTISRREQRRRQLRGPNRLFRVPVPYEEGCVSAFWYAKCCQQFDADVRKWRWPEYRACNAKGVGNELPNCFRIGELRAQKICL
jgi:hypothetical protein